MPWLAACKWLASSSGWETHSAVTPVICGMICGWSSDFWQDFSYSLTIFDIWFTYILTIWLWLAMIELSTVENIHGHTLLISEIFNFTLMTAPRPSKPPRLPVFVKLPSDLPSGLLHSEYCQVQSVQMKEHHGMVCTSQWIWHHCDNCDMTCSAKSLQWPVFFQVNGAWPTWCPLQRLGFMGCLHQTQRGQSTENQGIGFLIQFTCIVLKSYFIGLLSLHGCIIWCQLNQRFPEFVNVVRPSDLEARQSEPLRHCRRRRFWLEGCSHPICLVAQLCLGHLGKGKANAIWEALAALKTSLPLNKKQLCSSHTGNRRWLYCPIWIRTKILSDSMIGFLMAP